MIERGTLLNGYVYVLKRTGVAAILAAAMPGYVSAQAASARPPAGRMPAAARQTSARCPEHKLSCPARFITCMAWDKCRHAAWIGTEGHGIYEFRPWAHRGRRWVHFSKGQGVGGGLADNCCYAIAVDDKARVWAGTDRHGVDVLVSRKKGWQRYDVLPLVHPGKFGPMGSHPFAIAVDPYQARVWLATEAGISIYNTRRTHDRPLWLDRHGANERHMAGMEHERGAILRAVVVPTTGDDPEPHRVRCHLDYGRNSMNTRGDRVLACEECPL